MKPFYLLFVAALFFGCGTSRRLNIDFGSQRIRDTIISNLKHFGKHPIPDIYKERWVAIIRDEPDGFSIIFDQRYSKKDWLYESLVKKTTRYIKLDPNLNVPVIFQIDFLSNDFQRLIKGSSLNYGGLYFHIAKENGEYQIMDKRILF